MLGLPPTTLAKNWHYFAEWHLVWPPTGGKGVIRLTLWKPVGAKWRLITSAGAPPESWPEKLRESYYLT